jgi:hypothetical protein
MIRRVHEILVKRRFKMSRPDLVPTTGRKRLHMGADFWFVRMKTGEPADHLTYFWIARLLPVTELLSGFLHLRISTDPVNLYLFYQ